MIDQPKGPRQYQYVRTGRESESTLPNIVKFKEFFEFNADGVDADGVDAERAHRTEQP